MFQLEGDDSVEGNVHMAKIMTTSAPMQAVAPLASPRSSARSPWIWMLSLLLICSLNAPTVLAQIPTRIIANPSFEEPNLNACPNGAGSGIGYGQPPQDQVPGWLTSHTSITPPSGGNCPLSGTYPAPIIELWESNFLGVPAQNGIQFAELNAEEQARLYQEICLQAGETVSYSYYHRARQFNGETSRAGLYSTGGVLLDNGPNDSATTSAWTNHSGTLTNPGSAGTFQYGFEALNAGTLGNFIDNVTIDLPPVLELVGITPASGIEDVGGSLDLQFYVSGTLDNAATFTFTLAGASTATAGVDFTVATGPLSRGNVDSFVNGTITATIPGGNYYDPNETGGIGQGLISIPLVLSPNTVDRI